MFHLWLSDCPNMGIEPLLQFPHPLWAGPVLLTLLFFPLILLSYQVLHGSIYSFLLVRYSCSRSASVLHALLHLKVYSWCIHGKRCTPHPPTLTPSCFPQIFGLCQIFCFRIFLWSQNLVCDFGTHVLSLLENSEIITQPIVFWHVTFKIIFNVCYLDFKIIFASCWK